MICFWERRLHLQASKIAPKNYDMPTEEWSPNPRHGIVPLLREAGNPIQFVWYFLCGNLRFVSASKSIFSQTDWGGGGLDMLEHFVIFFASE